MISGSDEKLEKDVRKTLVRTPRIDPYEITVNVVNGVANLYGRVDTYFEKALANDTASKVPGIRPQKPIRPSGRI